MRVDNRLVNNSNQNRQPETFWTTKRVGRFRNDTQGFGCSQKKESLSKWKKDELFPQKKEQ